MIRGISRFFPRENEDQTLSQADGKKSFINFLT